MKTTSNTDVSRSSCYSLWERLHRVNRQQRSFAEILKNQTTFRLAKLVAAGISLTTPCRQSLLPTPETQRPSSS